MPNRYVYDDVPEEIYKGIISSDSAGTYFAARVKGGGFKFTRYDS